MGKMLLVHAGGLIPPFECDAGVIGSEFELRFLHNFRPEKPVRLGPCTTL
jgi:hypothetical protein